MKLLLTLSILLIITCNSYAQRNDLHEELNSFIQTCDFQKAVETADQILASDSSDIKTIILKCKALSALSRYEESLLLLQNQYKKDTTSREVLVEIFNVFKQSGNTDGASRICGKLITMFPGNQYYRLQLANINFNEKNYRDALRLYTFLSEKDSSSVFILRQLAICYEELDNSDSAEFFYRKGLKMFPFDPVLTNKYANFFIRNKRYKESLELTGNYLNYDSTFLPVRKQNAYSYYLLNEYPAATRQFTRCLSAGDSSKFIFKHLGLSYYKQSIFDSASPFLLNAFLADTSDAYLCYYYGVAACRANPASPDTGISYLEKAISLLFPPPKFVSLIYKELGSAWFDNLETDSSFYYYNLALTTNPYDNDIRFKIAYQYDNMLNKKEAVKYYNEFLKNADSLNVSAIALKSGTIKGEGIRDVEIMVSTIQFAKDRINSLTGRKND